MIPNKVKSEGFTFAAHQLPMSELVIPDDKSMGDALKIQAKTASGNVVATKFAGTRHWLMEKCPVETELALKKY